MNKLLIPLSSLIVILSACSAQTKQNDDMNEPQLIGMPNPASKYCADLGGKTVIMNSPNGQYGICKLPDGTEIDEWELFRRDHPSQP